MKAIYTVFLLLISNVFMTFAWYGHLKFKSIKFLDSAPLIVVILLSWGIALLEYCFMIPANRIGFQGNDGPFSLIELRVIQEVISLTVFTLISLFIFRTETFRMNHAISFLFIVLAVYFAFKK